MLTETDPEAAARPLRLLLVEDDPYDADLLLHALRRAGYAPAWRRVQTAGELEQALQGEAWQIVLADYTLPDYSGLMALERVRQFDPDLPFIIVSGNVGEEVAVAAMRAGAHDYLMKGRYARLGAVIERELQEAENRRARRASERALHEARQRLQALSGRLLQLQEAERLHLARELHDEIGQSLTAMKLGLDALQQRLAGHDALALAIEVTDIAEGLLDKVRSLSLDLRPPQLDDLGLAAALHWLAKRQRREGGPAIVLDVPDILPRLETHIETACFRVAQEALTNALRHAGARQIRISLRLEAERFLLHVCDDGRGFDPAAAQGRAMHGASLGLVGMQERVLLAGGELHIEARPGAGCSIVAAFPATAPPSRGD